MERKLKEVCGVGDGQGRRPEELIGEALAIAGLVSVILLMRALFWIVPI